MSTFDTSAPAQGHQALGDVDSIRTNMQALRDNESSLEASPPANPVAGMFWYTSDSHKIYIRTSASSWLYLWTESDVPVATSTLTSHTGANITNATTVHGIRQGSGNGFDADKLDGFEATYFLASTHATTTTGVHGVGAGAIVGTTLTQTLTNKTLTAPVISGGSVTSNITVAGAYIDGRDPSVDGAKLDTYAGSGIGYGGFNGVVFYTATTDFTVPAGMNKVYVEMVGGGGGGADAGGGGGGGLFKGVVSVTPGGTYTVTIGAGGGGTTGGNGAGGGGNTTFGALATANGGGGAMGNAGQDPGFGGGSTGPIGRAGSNGTSTLGGTSGATGGDLAGRTLGNGGAKNATGVYGGAIIWW